MQSQHLDKANRRERINAEGIKRGISIDVGDGYLKKCGQMLHQSCLGC